MFESRVAGRYGAIQNRGEELASWPTDRQAEVLYPGELSCEHLQRIDVQTESGCDEVHGILAGLMRATPVCYAPEVFE